MAKQFGIMVLCGTVEEARAALEMFTASNLAPAVVEALPVPPVAPRPLNVPPAPIAPAQRIHAPTQNEELDADGVPYDPSIHSSGRTKNADGRWTKGRKKSVAPTVPAPQTPLPSTNSMIQTPTTIPAAPTYPAQPTAPAYPTNFSELLSWLYGPSVQLSADAQPVVEAFTSLGFSELAGLATRPDLIGKFCEQVNANCQR